MDNSGTRSIRQGSFVHITARAGTELSGEKPVKYLLNNPICLFNDRPSLNTTGPVSQRLES